MPTKGFRTITVGEDTYEFAERLSHEDSISISRLIRKALEVYRTKKLNTEDKVNIIAEVLEQREAKEGK